MKCSLVVLTKDSSATLDACLKSAEKIASEIVVVDSGSSDSTLEIAIKYGARIFSRELKSFGEQKQFALDQAKSDWVFVLDSDEEIPPPLLKEMKELLQSAPKHSAYRVPRKNFYLGRFLRFGSKYPDYQTRLIRKSQCHFSKDIVHEKVIVNSSVGVLKNPLHHYSYPNKEVWRKKLIQFAQKKSEQWQREGVRPSALNFIALSLLNPAFRFIRRYIFKGGFLDGTQGFLACLHDLLTEILAYSYLHQTSVKR